MMIMLCLLWRWKLLWWWWWWRWEGRRKIRIPCQFARTAVLCVFRVLQSTHPIVTLITLFVNSYRNAVHIVQPSSTILQPIGTFRRMLFAQCQWRSTSKLRGFSTKCQSSSTSISLDALKQELIHERKFLEIREACQTQDSARLIFWWAVLKEGSKEVYASYQQLLLKNKLLLFHLVKQWCIPANTTLNFLIKLFTACLFKSCVSSPVLKSLQGTFSF